MGEYIHFVGVKASAGGEWQKLDEKIEKRIDEYHQVFRGDDKSFDPIFPIRGWSANMGFTPCEQDYYHSWFEITELLNYDFDKPMTFNGQPTDMTWREYLEDKLGFENITEFLKDTVEEFQEMGATHVLTYFDN